MPVTFTCGTDSYTKGMRPLATAKPFVVEAWPKDRHVLAGSETTEDGSVDDRWSWRLTR